jgi:hypothetical protein
MGIGVRMDVVTFFKWDSKASKTTLAFPGLAIIITVAFFILYLFPDSSASKPIFDAVKPFTLSIIVCVMDAILILGMLYFQPTKEAAAKKKAVEDKKTVVISSAEEEEEEEERVLHDGTTATSTDKGMDEVETAEDKEEKMMASPLEEELAEEPELEATPEEEVIEEMEEPKPAAMVKSIITFPEDVSGGIYADTYIDAGNSTTLKLRQEVVEEIYLIG